MLCGGTGMPSGCGRFARQKGYSLAGENKAVNQIHYLRSELSAGLSPLGGDREGHSYLRKADNPEDPQSRDPHFPAKQTGHSLLYTNLPIFQCGSTQTEWKSTPNYMFFFTIRYFLGVHRFATILSNKSL